MAVKKGNIPWNKGLKYTSEMKARLNLDGLKLGTYKGRKHNTETRAKLSASHIDIQAGSKHPLYGTKRSEETKQKIIASQNPKWNHGKLTEGKRLRIRFRELMQIPIFERDNYTCQICNVAGGYLQIDHIKSWAEYPDLRFDINNCRTLCMACHYYVTFKRKLPQGVIWGHNLKRWVAS